jgi:RHS repeat-associated protein
VSCLTRELFGCVAIGVRKQVPSYTYPEGTDGASSTNVLTETDEAFDTTQHAYNSANEVWCTVEPANYLDGTRCPSSEPTSLSEGPWPGATITIYNSALEPTSVTDALGNTTIFGYTSDVSGVPNNLLYCTVDPVDYSNSVSCPTYGSTASGAITVTYDSNGDETNSTDALGNTTHFYYANNSTTGPGLLTSTVDPDGTTTSYTYNSALEVTQKQVSFNSYTSTTDYAYSNELLYCEVDPLETALSVTCPGSPTATSGATITFHDAAGRVIKVTNPLEGSTIYGYNDAGDLYCTIEPMEVADDVTCPSLAGSSQPTSAAGATIEVYNAAGQVSESTNPLGGETLYTYDAANFVTQTVVEPPTTTSEDPAVTTDLIYQNDHLIQEIVNPGGSQTETTNYDYDPNGVVYCTEPAAATAPECPAWLASWIASPPNASTLYSSSASEVDTSFTNADGDVVQSSDADGNTSVTAYDGDGSVYCSSDPTNVASWLSIHDDATYPYLCPSAPPSSAPTDETTGYTTTLFDDDGNALSSTNPIGDTTSYTYDGDGNVLTTTDPRGEPTTNCYYDEDSTGHCAYGAPSGGGSGGDLYSTTTPATSADPSGEATTYTYFPGDEVETKVNLAATATYAYDGAGDTLSTTYSSVASGYDTPPTVSSTYNPDGTVDTITDASGTTTYGYDAMGDVTSQELAAGSGTGLSNATTSYTYFPTGALDTMTYPAYSGHSIPTVDYTYDGTGALVSTTDWLGNEISYGHDADGNETSQDNDVSGSYPDGTSSTSLTYNAADLNTGASSSINCGGADGTLAQSFSASTGSGSENPDGLLTEAYDGYSGVCSGSSIERNYSYDDNSDVVYQGTTAQGSNPNNSAFDASGDPTTISSHDSSGNFDTYTQTFDAAGEVTGQSPVSGSDGVSSSYIYDTLGDQIEDTSTATTTYGFNAAGQMTRVTNAAGHTAYLYNGDGLETATTTPGSVTWTPPVDVDAQNNTNDVSCTSSSFCVAVDYYGNALTYNGSTWSSPSDINDGRDEIDVDCVSSSFCVSIGTNYGVTYNGSSWSSPSHIDYSSSRNLDALSCYSSSLCVAVDNDGDANVYSSGSWGSSDTHIDGTNSINSVSCGASNMCMAVDSDGNAIKYNGSTWTATSIDSTNDLVHVVCTSATFCMAVDTDGHAIKYNGTSWTSTDIFSTEYIPSLVCLNSSFCVAADSVGYVKVYNGSSWSSTHYLYEASLFNPVLSCASTTDCYAVEGTETFSYNGSWSSTPIDIDQASGVVAMSCPTTTFCAAADDIGYISLYKETDQTWSEPAEIDSTRSITATTCPSSTFCVAVGASGYATTYNGTSWSTPDDIDGTNTLNAVSCVSSIFCVAVDGVGNAFTYTGTWSSATAIMGGTRSVKAIDCVTASFCAAVGASGYTSIYNGSTWTSDDADGSNTLDAVSCVSATFCMAVDTSGNAVAYTGSWGTSTGVLASESVSAVDCVTSTFCVAGGASGYVNVYSGSWGTATQKDSTRTINALQCTSTSFCMAVDASGYALSYGGSTWSTPVAADAASAPLNTLSCASSSFCVAGDVGGNALTYNGSSWSLRTGVDRLDSISSISCPTSGFCVAVDTSGEAVSYQPTAGPTSQLTWDTNGSLPVVISDDVNDFIYGPTAAPVEEINLADSVPTYLTYISTDESWLSTNEAGNETGFWTYDAYGSLSNGTPTSAFGYAGQYAESTSGYTNLRARFYDASTGSFTSRDPDFAATDTAYTYAGGDPVNVGDPTGLCSTPGGTLLYSGPCATTEAGLRAQLGVAEAEQAQADAAAKNACHSWWSCGLEADANYAAGIGNAIASTVSFGHVHISEPFCGIGPSWAYDVGQGFGFAISLVGGGVAFDAIRAALFAGDAAEEAVAAETFFRSMSKSDLELLQTTGRIPATGETFISPSEDFASTYEGATVRLSVRAGTMRALEGIGVRDTSLLAATRYPEMPIVGPGWGATSAFFKAEGGLINIGLGSGPALDLFNESLLGWAT